MVKSVLSVSHQGLRDWIIQRVSAIIMTFYSLGLIFYLISHPDLSFTEWHSLFSCSWMKIATQIFLLSLLYHSWIGMWTVLTDYAKPYVLRALLNFFILLILIACFFWGLLILWSV
jgi:succinate dehydrogenase / fumarate reductase, membrane anchor subunit